MSAQWPGCTVDPTARVFPGVRLVGSIVGRSCCVGEGCDLVDVSMAPHSEFGRRALVRNVRMGFGSYTGSNVVIKDADIGRFCSISWNLSVGGADHDYSAASMYTPYWWRRTFGVDAGDAVPSPRTRLGNDVWVGCGANVLGGNTIGDGAVIAAGAVVTRDVPPYAIAAGVPTRVIKYRFCDEWIQRLLSVKWWDWPSETIANSWRLLSGKLDEVKLHEMELVAKGLH